MIVLQDLWVSRGKVPRSREADMARARSRCQEIIFHKSVSTVIMLCANITNGKTFNRTLSELALGVLETFSACFTEPQRATLGYVCAEYLLGFLPTEQFQLLVLSRNESLSGMGITCTVDRAGSLLSTNPLSKCMPSFIDNCTQQRQCSISIQETPRG